jgi:AcrR family transcriptional regulator
VPRRSEKTQTRPVARVGDADLVERRRSQIVEAATKLVSRQGFAKTVVRDIAQEADFSVGLVYEYVRSKEDILFLIYEYWASVWQSGLSEAIATDDDAIARLRAAVAFLVDASDEHPDVTHLFYREAGNLADAGRELSKRTERELVGLMAGVIDDAIREGLVQEKTDPTLLAATLILLCHGWVLKGYLLHPGRKAPEYSDWIVETTIRGCGTSKGIAAWERRNAA